MKVDGPERDQKDHLASSLRANLIKLFGCIKFKSKA